MALKPIDNSIEKNLTFAKIPCEHTVFLCGDALLGMRSSLVSDQTMGEEVQQISCCSVMLLECTSECEVLLFVM